jgi:hypothetical protein
MESRQQILHIVGLYVPLLALFCFIMSTLFERIINFVTGINNKVTNLQSSVTNLEAQIAELRSTMTSTPVDYTPVERLLSDAGY